MQCLKLVIKRIFVFGSNFSSCLALFAKYFDTLLIFHNFLLPRLSNNLSRYSRLAHVLITSALTRLSNLSSCRPVLPGVLILSVLTRLSNLKLGSHRIITFLRQNAVNTINLICTDLYPEQYTCLLVLDLFLCPPN